MLRDRVVEWLDSQNDVTNVLPVGVRIHSYHWQGAIFTRGDETSFYLIGKRPQPARLTCYVLDPPLNCQCGQYEWYVGGFLEGEKTEGHPFGSHWLLVPWIIEGEPDSKIDEYSDDEYTRTFADVEIL